MGAIKAPNLVRSYESKIAAGGQWPLQGLSANVKKFYQQDQSGRIVFEENNNPSSKPMEGICFILGMPLPSEEFSSRLTAFNQNLSGFLDFSKYNPSARGHFHISFLGAYVWRFGETTFSRPPISDFVSLAKTIRDLLSDCRFLTFYFDRLGLMDNGVIIACGFPQDSAPDLIRDRYFGAFPEVAFRPDIYHITIGRLLEQPTRKEHLLILRAIEEFNQLPLGTITFSSLKIGYEQRVLCPEIIEEIYFDNGKQSEAF